MRDVYKFIFLLGGVSLIGFFGVMPGLLNTIESGVEVFQKLADSITIAVPPSLPASMNFGIIFALARLRLNKIYCIQSQRIPVAARIQLFVLDKTGTLTEDGLSVMAVRPATGNKFENQENDVKAICPPNLKDDYSQKSLLTQCMATCHAISWLKLEGKDPMLVGDPLDVEMFLSTGWSLDEDHATKQIA